jgi:alkanesulfonate monooxygenase SsuD/methylene tetrahydromethanopterin reductase-like flavin-dependent oxidoreductase (luciferase family)
LPFAFADFFGGTGKHGPAVAEIYRREFSPSALCPEPKLNVALQVICASTEKKASRVASSRNYNRARRMLAAQDQEPRTGLLPPDQAKAMELTPEVTQYVKEYTEACIDGDPSQVRDGIRAAAERYGTDDVGIVTITYSLADRIRSYELIAREFELL